MRLARILNGVAVLDFRGDPELEITGIAYDSRAVNPGDLFVALKGRNLDGHQFIEEALSRGALALVTEHPLPGRKAAALLRVPDARSALAKLALRFYEPPLHALNLTGITGTNGKTTTSYLLEAILLAAGRQPGVLGTVNYRYPGHRCPAPVTTPESLDLMRTLRAMADAGVTDVVMEVSSHALAQGRTRECPFRTAVFTNLSRDHLDYHLDMEAYFEAKSRLFRNLDRRGAGTLTRGVINLDDPRGAELVRLTPVPVLTYGLSDGCAVRAEGIQLSPAGLTARLIAPQGEVAIDSALLGEFNVYNILAAAAAALSLGVDLAAVAAGVHSLQSVPGRLESVANSRGISLVVDYAHTPDALGKALQALRALTTGRLIVSFGCGGDRDRGKRPEMGRIAAGIGDLVIVTSDNPRTENPAAIAAEIEVGIRASGLERIPSGAEGRPTDRGYLVELDRRSAIRRAVALARAGDAVLIAGKGHEDYQIIGAERRSFDDRIEAAEAAKAGRRRDGGNPGGAVNGGDLGGNHVCGVPETPRCAGLQRLDRAMPDGAFNRLAHAATGRTVCGSAGRTPRWARLPGKGPLGGRGRRSGSGRPDARARVAGG